MRYQVVIDTLPGVLEPDPPGTLQLDAPAGMFVVAAFGHVLTEGEDYQLMFLGDAVTHSTTGPGDHYLIVDGQDRVTGVIFNGFGETEGLTADIEVGIICVGPDAVVGSATLTAGAAAVSYPAMNANSRVFLQRETAGGTTVGSLYEVTARTNSTGFTIGAILAGTGLTNALDTSVVAWQVIEA